MLRGFSKSCLSRTYSIASVWTGLNAQTINMMNIYTYYTTRVRKKKKKNACHYWFSFSLSFRLLLDYSCSDNFFNVSKTSEKKNIVYFFFWLSKFLEMFHPWWWDATPACFGTQYVLRTFHNRFLLLFCFTFYSQMFSYLIVLKTH